MGNQPNYVVVSAIKGDVLTTLQASIYDGKLCISITNNQGSLNVKLPAVYTTTIAALLVAPDANSSADCQGQFVGVQLVNDSYRVTVGKGLCCKAITLTRQQAMGMACKMITFTNNGQPLA